MRPPTSVARPSSSEGCADNASRKRSKSSDDSHSDGHVPLQSLCTSPCRTLDIASRYADVAANSKFNSDVIISINFEWCSNAIMRICSSVKKDSLLFFLAKLVG